LEWLTGKVPEINMDLSLVWAFIEDTISAPRLKKDKKRISEIFNSKNQENKKR